MAINIFMAHLISSKLRSQIVLWQQFSIVAPSIFAVIAIFLHYNDGVSWLDLLVVAGVLFFVTCVIWWHWCLFTMINMLSIMKDTDTHFENVTHELQRMGQYLKPDLKLLKKVDTDQ